MWTTSFSEEGGGACGGRGDGEAVVGRGISGLTGEDRGILGWRDGGAGDTEAMIAVTGARMRGRALCCC